MFAYNTTSTATIMTTLQEVDIKCVKCIKCVKFIKCVKYTNKCQRAFVGLLNKIYINNCEPGSSVGIATELWVGRTEDRIAVRRDFPPSRPDMGPTQPPV